MVSYRQKQHAKRISQATLDKFKTIVSNVTGKDNRFELICEQWQSFIDNDVLMEKLSSIHNFEALLGYQRQLSAKLSYEQALSRVTEKFAEIDLAIHLLREKKSSNIIRIPETTNYKTPDFLEKNGKELYESKSLKALSERAIWKKASEALDQIEDYAKAQSYDYFGGTVYIVTFDTPKYDMDLQLILEALKQELKKEHSFPFNLNLQVYSSGLYGDAYFR